MCALTMNENVFVLVDDPFAPSRADVAVQTSQHANGTSTVVVVPDPAHYRHTFLTLSPPGALEQLLTQLRARWLTTKQAASGGTRQPNAQQLTIDGGIFAIGSDWILRAGNVVLNGNTVKGMLLEAEYLPVPTMSLEHASELMSGLLVSVVPNVQDAKLSVVTISDAQWDDLLWDRDAETAASGGRERAEEADRVYVREDEGEDEDSSGDWVGTDRDRRSAYLIIGALKSEGLV